MGTMETVAVEKKNVDMYIINQGTNIVAMETNIIIENTLGHILQNNQISY